MQAQKTKLVDSIHSFPDNKNSFFEWDNLDFFPTFLESSFLMMKELYDEQTLSKIAQEDSFNFIFLINKLLDAFQVFDDWIKTNESALLNPRVNESSRTLLQNQAKELDDIVKRLKDFKTKTADVQKNTLRLEQENEQLSQKETLFKELIDNKQKLAARKEELLLLKKEVRENRLQDLANQVKQLEEQLQEKEKEKLDLMDKKNAIISQVNTLKTDTQKVLSETTLLGKANELLADIKKKCAQHNETVVEVLANDSEQLKLHLDFSISTSNDLLDTSIENLISETKTNLTSIDNAILKKIA